MKIRESGFTLIELVVVIVILGILAAVALPRFADMDKEARKSKVEGALGAVKSAAAIAHAQALAQKETGSTGTITMEGASVALVYGYPDVGTTGTGGIVTASGGLTDYYLTSDGTTLTVAADSTHTSCTITYAESTTSGGTPSISTAGPSSSNC